VPRRHPINYLAGKAAQKNLSNHYLALNRLHDRVRASSGASDITVAHPGDHLMRTPTQVANDYLAFWNELDQSRRQKMLASTWTSEATYVDPIMQGKGHSEISALVSAVHAKFPGFSFSLIGSADGHCDHVRFSWSLGPADGDAVIKGTDFVRVSGDHIASVTGFLDLVPAGA